MKALLALLLVCVAVFAASSAKRGLTTSFSSTDRDTLKSALLSSQRKDGSWGSVADTYYSVTVLQQLKADVPQKQQICDSAAAANPTDVPSAHYVRRTLQMLECGKTNQNAENTLEKALDSDKLKDLAFGIFGAGSRSTAAAAERILDLAEEDGTFLDSKKSDTGSILNAGLALTALAIAHKHGHLNGAAQDRLRDAVRNAFDISGESSNGMLEFVDDAEAGVSNMQVTGSLFVGLNAAAGALVAQHAKLASGVTADQVTQLAQYFLANRFTSSPKDAYFLLHGLNVASDNVFAVPVVVSLEQSSVNAAAADAAVRVHVTDVLARPVAASSVSLAQAVSSSDATKILVANQDLTLVDKDASVYSWNVGAAKPDGGAYSLDLRVTPSNTAKYASAESTKATLRVIGTATVTEFTIIVAKSEDAADIAAATKHTVEYGKKLDAPIKVAHNQHVIVEYKVVQPGSGKAVKVHQSFITIASRAKSHQIVAVSQQQGRSHRAHVSMPQRGEELRGQSGSYDLNVFVGDFYVDRSLSWTPAVLQVSFPESAAVADEPSPFAAKPAIEWTFRAPDSRAPGAISFLFTLAALAPLAVLLLGFALVGANINNFAGISALAFQIGLGSILALYALYWLRLNMLQTLPILAVLAAVTFFFGINTLNTLAGYNAPKTKRE